MNRRLLLAMVVITAAVLGVLAFDLGLHDREYDRTTVSIESDETGVTLATVEVRVAETASQRYIGLSNTESLDPHEGMLFVHDDADTRAYVMRDMAFAIDIVFIDADGAITAIHSAEPEEEPYTRYEGYGQYVLEVRYGYFDDHGIETGDRVVIDDRYA